jgi:hypothetical protein
MWSRIFVCLMFFVLIVAFFYHEGEISFIKDASVGTLSSGQKMCFAHLQNGSIDGTIASTEWNYKHCYVYAIDLESSAYQLGCMFDNQGSLGRRINIVPGTIEPLSGADRPKRNCGW